MGARYERTLVEARRAKKQNGADPAHGERMIHKPAPERPNRALLPRGEPKVQPALQSERDAPGAPAACSFNPCNAHPRGTEVTARASPSPADARALIEARDAVPPASPR